MQNINHYCTVIVSDEENDIPSPPKKRVMSKHRKKRWTKDEDKVISRRCHKYTVLRSKCHPHAY